MPALRKLAALAIAHAALSAGCATQVGHDARVQAIEDGEIDDVPADDELAAIEAIAQEPTPENPSGLHYLGHEGVELGFVEQWLLFVDLGTGEPIEGLSVCEPVRDDSCIRGCADTDAAGTVLTDWTPEEESYRMLGTLPDGTAFVLFDVASTVLINRTLRPIGVLTDAELEAHYTSAGVKLESGRHTVLARAYTGLFAAEGVRFTLHPAEAVADGGKDDALQGLDAGLNHGLFLDVAPGLYELRGARNGVVCSSAEVLLDGETAQVLAPELGCE